MAEQKPKRLRRVPEELRKRSIQSCDLCRKRRCKCVPSETDNSCQACLQSDQQCSYNLPRKHRIYGSLDDLSERQRCLEAIVRGAFPHETLHTVQDLLKLGNRHDFLMPDLQTTPPVPISSVAQAETHTELPKHRSATSRATNSFVRDRLGNKHYIGASSSLSFFAELREIVKTRDCVQNDEAHFVSDDTTKALEADGQNEQPELERVEQSPISVESLLLKQLPGQSRPELNYAETLPPNDTVETLLESFFKNVHTEFPLFHRATFYDELEMYVVQPRISNTVVDNNISGLDWGWLACLHMMMVFGSIAITETVQIDHETLRRDSLVAVTGILPHLLSKCTITNVQALLLQALFFHNYNERNGAWNLVGTAMRIAIALGLHEIEFSSSFRPIQREIRKRVFCTLFGFEQFLSSSLGRPSSIEKADIQVPRHSFLDEDGFGDQYIILNLQLQKLLGRTRGVLELMNLRSSGVVHNSASALDLLAARKSWQASLPSHLYLPDVAKIAEHTLPATNADVISFDELRLSLSRQPPHQIRKLLLLHVQHHYIGLLVSRSALLQDIGKGPTSLNAFSETQPSALACEYHAVQCTILLLALHQQKLLNGIAALDIFYAYQASMVLLLRILKQKSLVVSNQDKSLRGSNLAYLLWQIREAMDSTKKCSTMKRFVAVADKFYRAITESQNSVAKTRTPILNRQNTVPVQRTANGGVEALPLPTRSDVGWLSNAGDHGYSTIPYDQHMDMLLEGPVVYNPDQLLDLDDQAGFNPLDFLSDGQLLDWANVEAAFTT